MKKIKNYIGIFLVLSVILILSGCTATISSITQPSIARTGDHIVLRVNGSTSGSAQEETKIFIAALLPSDWTVDSVTSSTGAVFEDASSQPDPAATPAGYAWSKWMTVDTYSNNASGYINFNAAVGQTVGTFTLKYYVGTSRCVGACEAVNITSNLSQNITISSDHTSPSISTLTPADNATNVAVESNLIIKFSEPVISDGGRIIIQKDDESSSISIDTDSDQISGLGTDTITVSLPTNLEDSTDYHVLIEGSAFKDPSGNRLPGYKDDTIWNFTTAAEPVRNIIDSSAIEEETEKAHIDSWKAYRYTDNNKSCSQRLKLIIKGKYFDSDASVFIGNKEASSIDRNSSRKIVAKFCLAKLLDDHTDHKKTLYVQNPDTEKENANKQIDLAKITGDNNASENDSSALSTAPFSYSDTEVMALQNKLNKLGLLDSENVTGFFGPITKEAVMKLQEQNNFETTGHIGPLTKAKLEI